MEHCFILFYYVSKIVGWNGKNKKYCECKRWQVAIACQEQRCTKRFHFAKILTNWIDNPDTQYNASALLWWENKLIINSENRFWTIQIYWNILFKKKQKSSYVTQHFTELEIEMKKQNKQSIDTPDPIVYSMLLPCLTHCNAITCWLIVLLYKKSLVRRQLGV